MHHNCPKCKTKGFYAVRFDAFLCMTCDTWLEPNCQDPNCEYCKDRPTSPREFYLGKPTTYDTAIGDIISLDHFEELAKCNAISPDDGCTSAIFVDGVHQQNLYLQYWDFMPYGYPSDYVKPIKLEELRDKFPGKLIQIEWCNK